MTYLKRALACLALPAFLLALLIVPVLSLQTSSQAQAMSAPPLLPQAGGPTVVATVTVGSGPRGVGVNPTTNRIYVANGDGNSVTVIQDDGLAQVNVYLPMLVR